MQAAIAACHVTAARAADTDWAQIARLYGQLARFLPTPVVELNRAVAVGMAEGPQAGLALVAALEASGRLAGYHLLPATKADMYRRLGRADEAAACYREASAWPAPMPNGATSAAAWPKLVPARNWLRLETGSG